MQSPKNSTAVSGNSTHGQCRACGESSPLTAIICHTCGSRLPWAAAPAATPQKAAPTPSLLTSQPAPSKTSPVKFLPEEQPFWQRIDWATWGSIAAVVLVLSLVFMRAIGVTQSGALVGIPLIFVVRFILNQIFD